MSKRKFSESDWWNWKDDVLQALIKGDHLDDCSASGACDEAVAAALSDPNVRVIIDRLPEHDPHLMSELEDTGAWVKADGDLDDHDTNLTRIVWMMACDEKENRAEQAREARK